MLRRANILRIGSTFFKANMVCITVPNKIECPTVTARVVTKAHREKIEQRIARHRKNIESKAPFISLYSYIMESEDG